MTTSRTAPTRDRFDDAPVDLARVGAHRAPARSGRGFVTFAWAALATGALVGLGVLGLGAIESSITGGTDLGSSAAAGTSSSAAPKATVDAKIDVVVLNATTTNGLAATAAKRAKAAGWTVGSTANASTNDLKTSTVYYTKAGDQGAALGLAKSLGITRTAQSSEFAVAGQDRLTVVLGADWTASA